MHVRKFSSGDIGEGVLTCVLQVDSKVFTPFPSPSPMILQLGCPNSLAGTNGMQYRWSRGCQLK